MASRRNKKQPANQSLIETLEVSDYSLKVTYTDGITFVLSFTARRQTGSRQFVSATLSRQGEKLAELTHVNGVYILQQAPGFTLFRGRMLDTQRAILARHAKHGGTNPILKTARRMYSDHWFSIVDKASYKIGPPLR